MTLDVPALLAELTASEKAALITGKGFWWTRDVDRLAIPSVMVSDGPHGLRKQAEGGDHVGIGESVPATCFPTASALGSSWDGELVRAIGAAIGAEARTEELAVVLGPGINLKRSPLCGRNFEYLSEDPTLSGVLGAALVDGLQSQGVGASLKHFAANNQETDRVRVSAEVDERTLRELYLSAFERVVRTSMPWTVMCSYNRINGVYASQDRWLLTEVLRDEWGFDGLVVSDWGAVGDPVAAVEAGLDLEMPGTGGVSSRRVEAALADGSLDEAVLDTAVSRVLGLVGRAQPGLAGHDPVDHDAHHALARRAAAACTVLLRNDGDVLPLGAASGRVAVVGELARTPRYQGAGSSKVNPTRVDAALPELEAGLGASFAGFAPGYGVDDPAVDGEALRAEAVALASSADLAVVVLGLPPSYESEGYDRDHLDLPAEQVALLGAVAEVVDRVVVVLANGGVVAVAQWQHHADALVEGWLGGQAGGGAVADVLLGRAEPGGRLAETIPLRLADTPSYLSFPGEDGRVVYGEGLFVGYRHHDAVDGAVAYPFGHGGSYTRIELDDLAATIPPAGPDRPGWRGPARIVVEVTATNVGERAGTEVVQVYVGRPASPAPGPIRTLAAFAKVALEPGASERVRLEVDERDLSRWSTRVGGWVLDPGPVEVAVGRSSRDLPLRSTVVLDGEAPVIPLDRTSTTGEWLDHPAGREVLMEALRTSDLGDLTFVFDDPERVRMLSSFPLARLTPMFGGLLPDDFLDRLLGRVAATPTASGG